MVKIMMNMFLMVTSDMNIIFNALSRGAAWQRFVLLLLK